MTKPTVKRSTFLFPGLFAVLALMLSLLTAAVSISPTSASPYFANTSFQAVWEYSDKLVQERPDAGRGFTWGPNTFGIEQEDYADAPGGKRQVQYFDKSRMELSSNNGQNVVTNGLLTKELVTGQRQDGNSTYTQLPPSTTQIAGDDNSGGGNGNSPTYASFKGVISLNPGENAASDKTGQNVNQAIAKDGTVTTLNNPPASVVVGTFEGVFKHNVPKVFVDFENQQGLVWNAGRQTYQPQSIYTDNPTANVFGFPVSESYWIKAVIGGQEKDVLVQLFERRVLTYTPTNNDPYKVEMGNIGQHYYQWRHSNSQGGSTTPQPGGGGNGGGNGNIPATSCLAAASNVGDLVQACVDKPSPTQNSNVTVFGRLVVGGNPVNGATMNTIWNYKTTQSDCSGTTGSDGVASCVRDISRATVGYTVRIDVSFNYNGKSYTGSTSFTPVDSSGSGGGSAPTPTPTPKPTTAPPSTTVTFVSVQGGKPGQTASVTVQTSANASCSITYITPAGTVSTAAGLDDKNADSSGRVSWSWKIGTSTKPGTGTVRVTCNGVTASTGITIG